VTLKPEILRKLVLDAHKVIGNYQKLGNMIGCSETEFCRYKKHVSKAVSVNRLSKLSNISGITFDKDDIVGIQRGKLGYKIPFSLVFSEKIWSILDEWDHYILGAIATDGSVYKGNIYFKISPRDVEFSAVQIYSLAKMAEKIHQQHVNIYVGIDRGKKFGEPTTSVALSSISLIIFLQKVLGLNFSTNYNVPEWFNSNSEYLYPWLAGVTDGDGYVWKTENKYGAYWFWDITNGNINPLNEIKQILEKYVAKFETNPKSEGRGKYKLRIQHIELCRKLFPKILPYIVIERKRRRIIEALDYLAGKGFDIKIPEKQRDTRNPIIDKAVEFLKERNLFKKIQNWERLEVYGEGI